MLFPVVLLLCFSLFLSLLLLLSSPTTISIAAFSYSDLPLSLPLSLPIELVQSCPHAHLYSATVAMTCDKCCTDSLQHKRLLLYFLEHDGKMHPRSEPVFLLLLLLKAPCQGVCANLLLKLPRGWYIYRKQFHVSTFGSTATATATATNIGADDTSCRQQAINVYWQDFSIFQLFEYIQNINWDMAEGITYI